MIVSRPRRSVLFMPASNERALEKAKTLPCDTIVFDLEDATAPDKKDLGRALAVAAVKAGGYGKRELVIRINGLDTDWWQEDIAAVAECGAAAIIVPKVEGALAVQQVEAALVKAGDTETVIWAMLETAKAILKAEDVATASPRLECLLVGTNDLTKDIRAERVPGRAPVLVALATAVLAARAYGHTVLDGVYNNFRDAEGLQAECDQGRAMGFDGKSLIHPLQIDIANEAFGPSASSCAEARALISAFEEAAAAGKGVAVFGGKMIEELHVLEAKRLLAVAAAIEGNA
ncbi:MAG: CoA ester lyase [Kordiimonadales bacterium]|nr:MAG: CoA ester lyase [Kordiimonadales bacterium]